MSSEEKKIDPTTLAEFAKKLDLRLVDAFNVLREMQTVGIHSATVNGESVKQWARNLISHLSSISQVKHGIDELIRDAGAKENDSSHS